MVNDNGQIDVMCMLHGLSMEQQSWAIARLSATSDAAAARACGVATRTVYSWPSAVRQAPSRMRAAAADVALQMRRDALIEAMAVKIEGLRSLDERIRQAVASEILRDELGGLPDGAGQVTITLRWPD